MGIDGVVRAQIATPPGGMIYTGTHKNDTQNDKFRCGICGASFLYSQHTSYFYLSESRRW